MFSTFDTEHGSIVIRTADLRTIWDRSDGCFVTWVRGDESDPFTIRITGTVRENMARLRSEELAAFVEAERYQQRQYTTQQAIHVGRGRVKQ